MASVLPSQHRQPQARSLAALLTAALLLVETPQALSASTPGRPARWPRQERELAQAAADAGDVIGQLKELVRQAQTSQENGDFRQAALAWEKIVAIVASVQGPDHPDTARAINNLALLNKQLGHYEEAEALYIRSIKIYETKLGPESPDLALSLNNLAGLYCSQGNYEQAEPLLKRSLAIREKSLEPNHPDIAQSFNNLAELYRARGRYTESESLYGRSLQIYEKTLGPESADTATCLENLATLYQTQGRFAMAEAMQKRSLAIRQKILGADHPDIARGLDNLARLETQQGHYTEAVALALRALAIREKTLGAEHPDTAQSLSTLAGNLREQGRYGEAEPLYRRALTINENALGPNAPETASSLNSLALLSENQGRYQEAERLNKLSLAIQEKTLGPSHPDVAKSLNNLAELDRKLGRYAEAESLFQRSLSIREKSLGIAHPITASSLNNLASLYADQERYREAELLSRKAYRINSKSLGTGHPDVANNLNNLATMIAYQGRLEEARTLYERALAILEQSLGSSHPDTALSLNNLGAVQLLQGQTSAAASTLTRLNHSQANWLRRELPLLPRELRMTQLQAQADAVATTFALLDQDPSSVPLALETRLNRQGLLAEIEQRQRLLLASSPETRALGERLAGLDRQLASITLSPSQRADLRQQRQQLEADLNRRLPALKIEPVTTAQVAGALHHLAPQGLLVEFQRYRPWLRRGENAATSGSSPGSDGGSWGAAQYMALLLSPDGRITAVPLGDAAPIDQAIGQALSASMASSPDALETWARVGSLVLAPLAPQLRGVHELFLSPDGGLHRVPFAALPMPGESGRLLSEGLRLRLLTTGRELLRLQQPISSGGPAALIANPDYGMQTRVAATALPPSAATEALSADERQLRSGSLGSGRIWSSLPATALEARALAPLLGVSRPITGGAATTKLVLHQQAPRILHIATHGFFEPDQPPPPSPMSPLSTKERGGQAMGPPPPSRREDPLLRSGLVLAGANHPDADPSDDGYLTAAEVTGMRLDGTELVTLSACQTALGDLQTGEGVYGLQRALTVAGSRSTLLSLWSVDDGATRAFMETFYQHLEKGMGRADALAATQAAFRNHPNPLYRSVFVWGAFQLTGDWRPLRR